MKRTTARYQCVVHAWDKSFSMVNLLGQHRETCKRNFTLTQSERNFTGNKLHNYRQLIREKHYRRTTRNTPCRCAEPESDSNISALSYAARAFSTSSICASDHTRTVSSNTTSVRPSEVSEYSTFDDNRAQQNYHPVPHLIFRSSNTRNEQLSIHC